MELLKTIFSVGIIAATFRMAVSVAYASLGTVFATRSGVLHMGQEGFMLTAALAGAAISFLTKNVWIGICGAMVTGALLGLIYAFFTVSNRGNDVIIGVGFNFFGLGLSTIMLQAVWGNQGTSPSVPGIYNFMTTMAANAGNVWQQIFGTQNLLFVALLVIAIMAWIFLYRTPYGLRIRITGELPVAVACTGGNVIRIRYVCLIISGILIALAGATVSLGQVKMFGRDMMGGRGFVGLAMCALGRYHPIGAVIGSMLYGFTEALQIRLQGEGVPAQFVQMIPYVFTIIVIALSGSGRAPAAMGKPLPEDH
ncbi:MAG: ABC transporter permease [Clostridia bacterium]